MYVAYENVVKIGFEWKNGWMNIFMMHW
jgi:hypothetical protein